MLDGKPSGAFLLRCSSRPACLSLDVITEDGWLPLLLSETGDDGALSVEPNVLGIAGEFKSLQALLEAAAEQLRYPVWTPAALAAGAVEGDTFDPATSSATVRKVVERRDSADGVALLGARPLVSRGLPSSLASIGKSSREGEDESSVLMMEGDEESNILMDADDGLGGSFGDDVMLM
eukprot:PLAT15223.2.p1 GENE.PLAT15223.2~~PLAT15223.2.p1  ORF type:complete len:208 (+),score=64.95 PLAT15223.2:92-625(+)